MEFLTQQIVVNIKQEEIEDGEVLDQFTAKEDFVGDIKHEPERHFVFIMPDDPEPESEEMKEVKIVVTKFDKIFKYPAEMFESYFYCDKCDNAVKKQQQHQQHLKTCKNLPKCGKCFLKSKSENVEDCGYCHLKFDCKNCMMKHQNEDHRKGSNWQCSKCDYKTMNKQNLRNHYRIHIKKVSCETCKKKFSFKSQLKTHQQQHRHGMFATLEIKFDCQICVRSFATKDGLKYHKNRIHSERKFHCDICGNIFKNKGVLRRHMETHFKVSCPICQHMIAESYFKDHIEQHSTSAKFKCDECEKVYFNKNHLNIHKNTKHEINEVKCDLCSKIFKNKLVLRGHMINHIKIPCQLCMNSISKNAFKRHMKIFHSSGEKFLACKIMNCKQKFENIKELKEHKQIHIRPGIFKCQKCEYQAKNDREFKNHMKRKH